MIKKRESGFTLIEMLIALVIVSVAFTAVIFSVNQNVRTLLALQRKTAAIWLAEDVITRAQIGFLRADSGSDTLLTYPMRWRITSKNTQNPKVIELTVTVTDAENQSILMKQTAYKGAGRG